MSLSAILIILRTPFTALLIKDHLGDALSSYAEAAVKYAEIDNAASHTRLLVSELRASHALADAGSKNDPLGDHGAQDLSQPPSSLVAGQLATAAASTAGGGRPAAAIHVGGGACWTAASEQTGSTGGAKTHIAYGGPRRRQLQHGADANKPALLLAIVISSSIKVCV